MIELGSQYRIRSATSGDISAIAKLEQESSKTPWSEASIAYDIESNEKACVLVVSCCEDVCDKACELSDDSGERVVAYADAWLIAGEAQLNNIAVSAEYRRQHIGESLLQALIDSVADSCETMQLEVRESNIAARELYNKMGFKEVGRRASYYEDNGETAVLMDMEIN